MLRRANLHGACLLPALLLWGAVAGRPQQAGPGPMLSSTQQQILDLTNQDRKAQGLGALTLDASLVQAATAHAAAMAAAGSLAHQYPGEPDVATRTSAAGAHFRAVAENIAYGPDAQSIERQWMRSVPHRTNILDPQMTAIGIGVVAQGGGLYAVEDFAAATPALSLAAIEQIVEQQLRSRGLATAAAGSEEKIAARAACPTFEGAAGAHARLVLRWESGDLAKLPQPLTDGMASGQYTRAAVGACPAINTRNQAFTAYRVAVLLF